MQVSHCLQEHVNHYYLFILMSTLQLYNMYLILETMPEIDMKKWKKHEPSYHTFKYCAEPGPTTPTLPDTPALEYLQLFFTDNVWELCRSHDKDMV